MSEEHETCNHCVEMNHDLMIEVHFNPKSIFMKTGKDGLDSLVKKFSRIFCDATGGRVVEVYKVKNSFVIKTEVYADTFALFEADYDMFMATVFGGVSLIRSGVSQLSVFNHAQKKLQMQRQFIENIKGDNRG